jgi:threonine aldolase
MPIIDLRSDTVTRPSPGMREAMARAEVGDDVYGEDPTVTRLEREVAALLGKEAALFVPSGTMGNQIALLLHTRPGDEVIVGEGAHLAWYESGAGAAIAGVQFASAGRGGTFSADDVRAAAKPLRDYHPRTSLVAVENTHNRGGGKVFPASEVMAVASVARELGLGLHLDGARLWNAAVASGCAVNELAAPFDTVSVCFSKGLGAPVGSALSGSREAIGRARRFRKMLGGGMRQAGILAAGALYALEHQRERLKEDHANARLLAVGLAQAGFLLDPATIETNVVIARLENGHAEQLAALAADSSVLVGALDARTLRFVTHLDVDRNGVREAIRVLTEAWQRCGSSGGCV